MAKLLKQDAYQHKPAKTQSNQRDPQSNAQKKKMTVAERKKALQQQNEEAQEVCPYGMKCWNLEKGCKLIHKPRQQKKAD